ncbi:MAG: RHS repeat-associated core domain-containing protein [Pseudomonadota bacterium]
MEDALKSTSYLALYSYDASSNKLMQTVSGGNTTDYTYDDNGNTILSSTGQTATSFQAFVDYTYNHNGQRIKKVAIIGTTVTTTIFHYDQFGNIIAETDESGNPKCTYVYLNGMLLAKIDGNPASENIYYYHNDHLGTPQMLTNSAGVIVWSADYDPFGKAQVSASSTIENNMRFPGQYYDAETGLHYNYYRYYDPSIGRYLTPDPIGLAGGINLYVYVGGNPVNFVDPYGLVRWDTVILGGFEVVAGATTVGLGSAASASGVGAVGGVPAVLGGTALFSHGVSRIIVGFTDNELNIPVPTIPATATLAATGDINRANQVDMMVNIAISGSNVGSWAGRVPSNAEMIGTGIDLTNQAVQSTSIDLPCEQENK